MAEGQAASPHTPPLEYEAPPQPVYPTMLYPSLGMYVDRLIERIGDLEKQVVELKRDMQEMKANLNESRSPFFSQAPTESEMSHEETRTPA